MRHHVRCRCCQKRRVLKLHPDTYYKYSVQKGTYYSRAPKCAHCGGQDYRLDGWMMRRNTRAVSCACSGYVVMTRRAPWPHRMGSPYCHYRADGTERHLGDPDFKDYQLEAMNHEQQS